MVDAPISGQIYACNSVVVNEDTASREDIPAGSTCSRVAGVDPLFGVKNGKKLPELGSRSDSDVRFAVNPIDCSIIHQFM